MTDLTPHAPRPTAQVEPYVDVLGIDGAVEFLLAFGGAEISLPANPTSASKVVQLVGRPKAVALARISGRLPRRVPTARRWLVLVLFHQGLSKNEIARKLHITDVIVRRWLKEANASPQAEAHKPAPSPQLSLPFWPQKTSQTRN